MRKNKFKIGDIVKRTGPSYQDVITNGCYRVLRVELDDIELEDLDGNDILGAYDVRMFELYNLPITTTKTITKDDILRLITNALEMKECFPTIHNEDIAKQVLKLLIKTKQEI